MSSPYVFEATEATFRQDVVERSREKPVLVDFWATWCGPCKVLGPILEKLAQEYEGRFLLAKVDTDANPNLAAAFQIRSIPTVMLLLEGRMVDGFTGAMSEAEVRDFLKPHVPGKTPEPLEDAETLFGRGDLEGARRALSKVLEEDPEDAKAHLLLARIGFQEGDEDATREQVEKIPEGTSEARTGATLLGAFRFRKECEGDVPTWQAKVEADPDDLPARYALGCCLAAEQRYEEALEAFLEVVKRDKKFKDGAAHQAMLAIFGIVGGGSDAVRDVRHQLAIYL